MTFVKLSIILKSLNEYIFHKKMHVHLEFYSLLLILQSYMHRESFQMTEKNQIKMWYKRMGICLGPYQTFLELTK